MRSGVVVGCALVLVSLSLTACHRRRTEQQVSVDVAQQPSSGGGYVVGAAGQGQAQAPDYVSQHMSVRYQQYAPDMVPSSPLYHGYLQQGQEESFQAVLETGRCYRVIGVGGPAMQDLDLFIVDENNNAITQDTATDNFPVLGQGSDAICPLWTGNFFVRALAYRGYGEYGLQVFSSQ